MKQGDFWTALLQNTKRLPPRSVPHQLRAYGTHFSSQKNLLFVGPCKSCVYRRIFVYIFCLISTCLAFSCQAFKTNSLNIDRAYNFSYLCKFESDIPNIFGEIIFGNSELCKECMGLLGSLSSNVFERCTSTGSKRFSF